MVVEAALGTLRCMTRCGRCGAHTVRACVTLRWRADARLSFKESRDRDPPRASRCRAQPSPTQYASPMRCRNDMCAVPTERSTKYSANPKHTTTVTRQQQHKWPNNRTDHAAMLRAHAFPGLASEPTSHPRCITASSAQSNSTPPLSINRASSTETEPGRRIQIECFYYADAHNARAQAHTSVLRNQSSPQVRTFAGRKFAIRVGDELRDYPKRVFDLCDVCEAVCSAGGRTRARVARVLCGRGVAGQPEARRNAKGQRGRTINRCCDVGNIFLSSRDRFWILVRAIVSYTGAISREREERERPHTTARPPCHL